MGKSTIIAIAVSLLTISSVAIAQDQDPVAKHPDLRDARQAIATATSKLEAAKNGKAEFGGHRAKAEQFATSGGRGDCASR
jgi:hypothetical protein